VLNTVRSIVYHLNDVNWVNMTQKMIALPINNIKLLDDITDIIFDRVCKLYIILILIIVLTSN